MKFFIGLVFVLCPTTSRAYEVTTHALITHRAYLPSTLNPATPNSIVLTLGFDRLDFEAAFPVSPGFFTQDFRIANFGYFDDATRIGDFPRNVWRTLEYQEQNAIDNLFKRGYLPQFATLSSASLSFDGWLMRGAVREDDNDGLIDPLGIGLGLWVTGDDRDLDPYGRILRAVKHFYDPIRDLAYPYASECGFYSCVRATTWLAGTSDPLLPAGSMADPNRRQHFAWVDARDDYFHGLTLTSDANGDGNRSSAERKSDSQERMWRFATSIKSIGHVVHLLQDAAQPQHVRSDAHAPPKAALEDAGEGLSDAAIEAFTDYRILGEPDNSLASVFAGNPLRTLNEELPGAAAVPGLILGTYPGTGQKIQFATPVKFYTTRHVDTVPGNCGGSATNVICGRRGLADFTNRSFFTSGTTPGNRFCTLSTRRPYEAACPSTQALPFPFPPENLSDNSFAEVMTPSGLKIGNVDVMYSAITRQIIDSIAPSYVDPTLANFGGRIPLVIRAASARAISTIPTATVTMPSVYSYLNMRYTADVAIPRAVGYSVGMIDFFFRGRLKVEAPVDGLFGAIDHSIPHSVDTDGYPICSITIATPENWCTAGRIFGFTKLRLKVRNVTADIVESGTNQVVQQTMVSTVANPSPGVNAGLYAVARYHRNSCYQPSLTGERTYNNTNGAVIEPIGCSSTRTEYQEISVSRPKVVSAAELNTSTSTAMAFDFTNDPIPVNATDLFLQVVYRGQLGEETDGVAVGAIDAREPGYVTMWNNTDWGGCNGAWLQSFGVGCTPAGTTNRAITTANLCVGSQILLSHNQNLPGGGGALGSGRYLRVAVIGDGRTLITRARTVYGTTGITDLTSRSFAGPVRQSAQEIPTVAAPFITEPFFNKRGRIGSNRGIAIHLVSGANPQPISDQGPLDVGNLLPSFAVTDPPAASDFSFPDAPLSVGACPAATN